MMPRTSRPYEPGFAAKTRRVGAQRDGKLVGIQRLVAKQIGDRHFGGGREPEIVILDLEQILLELGKLAGAEQAGGVDQERRQHLGVAVLARVDIQHEVDERPLQLRAHAPVDGKSRAGDFGGTLQVQDAQLRAQVPMRFGFEIELARLAPAADFDVVLGALADRHRFVRNIGNAGQQSPKRFIESS